MATDALGNQPFRGKGPIVEGQPRQSQAPPPKSQPWVKLLVVLLFVGVTVFFVVRAPTDQPDLAAPTTGATSAASGSPTAGSLAVERCRPQVDGVSFRIGDEGSGPAQVPLATPEPADGGEPQTPAQRYAPFAVVLGRGTITGTGYAVGVKRDVADGSVAEVALVDAKRATGRLIRLGQARGDVEAPLVVSAGEELVAAMLEPNASGFSLRLARVRGDRVDWAAELPQERDESLAFDVAVGADRVAVAWDEAVDEGERTRIVLATLDRGELRATDDARPISPEQRDAELPRLVAHAGGFWLVYVARRSFELPPQPGDEELGRDPKQERYAAEMIEHSWLEVMPLEPTGAPSGPARALSAKDGHVQAFDVEGLPDGGLVVAWRDDDTPTGAQGGRVELMVVSSGGVGESRVVADEDVGLGVPTLLPGWISLAGTRDDLRLAPLGADGQPQGAIAAEPVLGLGQLLAADARTLLLARPHERAVELFVVTCDRTPVPEPAEPAAADSAVAPADAAAAASASATASAAR